MSAPPQINEFRKHITIVFSDMCGSTHISSQLEPEVYSAILVEMRAQFFEIIEKYGGTLLRIDGDGFLFAFGHPVVFEDATRRAILTALDIHKAVNDFNRQDNGLDITVKFHTSIHAGTVLVRDGDKERGAYEILGRPTNVAARILDAAAPDEILISDSTLGGDRRSYPVSDLVSVKLQNQNEPVLARRVLALTHDEKDAVNGSESARYSTTPFVGRDLELNSIWGAVKSPDAVILIQAEAGMGKSRLLHVLQRQSVQLGYSTKLVTCSPEPGASALYPILQLLLSAKEAALENGATRNLTARKQIIDEIDALIALDTISTSEAELNRMADLVTRAINELQSDQEHLVIIDDWQFADSASAAIIEKIALSQKAANATFVFATRQIDDLFANRLRARTVILTPLTSSSIEQAAQHLAPEINPFVLKQVQSLSGGNPLFLEELCYAVKRDRGKLKTLDQNVWLRSLISDRYSKLTPELARVLRVAAVIGNTLPTWVLKGVLQSGYSKAHLARLQEEDFLFAEKNPGQLRFKHGLTRDAIYDVIGLHERRQIHGEIAKVLSQLPNPTQDIAHNAQLAYHYGNSGQFERAIEHSVWAGETALLRSSLDKAQQHFQFAFENIEKKGAYDLRTRTIIHKYGLACIIDPSWEQLEVLEQAVLWSIRFQDDQGLAWSNYWLASLYYGLGEPKRATRFLEQAGQLARSLQDARLDTQIEASRGQFLAATGAYGSAYRHINSAVATKLKNRSGDRASSALAYAVSCRAFALADQGRFDEGEASFEEALTYLNETRHQTAMSIIGHRSAAALWRHEYQKTVEYSSQVLEMAEQMRSRYHYAMSKALLAAASFYQTGDADDLKQIEIASNWMISDGSQQYISLNYGYLVDGYARLEDWPNVRRFAARALQRARKGDRLGESIAYRGLALAAAQGHTKLRPEIYVFRALEAAKRRESLREIEHTQAIQRQLERSSLV
ncbi:MAG: adenylate/guanylate cyclase domain-containing protein [Pseudomonadota bacterium]